MSDKTSGLLAHNEDLERLTIKSIEDALAFLLEYKEFDAISITELCKKAGVSRTAFYSHFKTKEDVIDAVNLEVVHMVIEKEYTEFDSNTADYSFYMGIFTILEQRIDTMRIFVSKGFQYRPVYGFYLSMRLQHVSQEERQKKLVWFAALEGLIFDWLKDKDRKDKETVSRFCVEKLTLILF